MASNVEASSYSPFGAGQTTPLTPYDDQGLDTTYSGSFENLHSPVGEIHPQQHHPSNSSPPLPSFADTYSASGSYTCLHRDEGKTESMNSLTNFSEESSPSNMSQQHPVMHYHGQYQMIADDGPLLRHQHPTSSYGPTEQILDYFSLAKHPSSLQPAYPPTSATPQQYPPDQKDAVFQQPSGLPSSFPTPVSFQSPYFDQSGPSSAVFGGMHPSAGGPVFSGSDVMQRPSPYQRRASLSSMGSPLSPE